MWAIRILSGPQAGQIVPLKSGRNRMGRIQGLEISVQSPGISKEHFEITILGSEIILKDLRSSNGTFLNGVRVQQSKLREGDKIGAHDFLFELIKPSAVQNSRSLATAAPSQAHAPVLAASPQPIAVANEERVGVAEVIGKAEDYRDRVLLPGVYHLIEVFEFRNVIIGFAMVFILLMTVLSVFPLQQITSDSIATESRRRAQTVARALAQSNEKIVRQGDLSKFSTDFVLREDGIEDVYVVSREGNILAPPERAGSRAREIAFLKEVLGQTKEIAKEIDSSRVAAAYPILVFDTELQQNAAQAYAVVIFQSASLQFDDGRARSLFIQMLIMGLGLGAGLFYLMFKLVEYPWVRLNDDLDQALREKSDQVALPFVFPALQKLLVSLNSLLVRANHPPVHGASLQSMGRDHEMKVICDLNGFPSLVLNVGRHIVAMNAQFEGLTGLSQLSANGQQYGVMLDPNLHQAGEKLTALSQQSPGQVFSEEIELAGHQISLNCTSLCNANGEAEYFILTCSPRAQRHGGAA